MENHYERNDMSDFDMNANPEGVAARAAELALEQLDRLRSRLEHGQGTNSEIGIKFYSEPFEVQISNSIGQLMGGYAVLKGYVTPEQAHINVE
jgi:hypothetical protein